MIAVVLLINVDNDSATVSFIDTPETRDVMSGEPATVTRRRASHVVPVPRIERALFVALRSIVRDDSRAAAWTRRWSCDWMVDLALSGGPVLTGFKKRTDAIAAEVAWLNEHL